MILPRGLDFIYKAEDSQVLSYANSALVGRDATIKDGFLYAKGRSGFPLLVAHVDTVHKTPPHSIFFDPEKKVIWSPEGLGADDRSGVWAVLQIAKSHPECGVLLTEGEEAGGWGARMFLHSHEQALKSYSYMIELDRKGRNDAVFYGTDTPPFVAHVTSFGWVKQHGTFSDISILMESGVAGVNLSIGYYNQHSLGEYQDLKILFENVKKVGKMCVKGKHFTCSPKTYDFEVIDKRGVVDLDYYGYRPYGSLDDDIDNINWMKKWRNII